VQIGKSPQITFGIKHSPLLGQLKPIEPMRPIQKEVNPTSTVQNVSQTTERKVVYERYPADQNGIVRHNEINDLNERQMINESNFRDSVQSRTQVTHVRAESGMRSSTVTPEPVQEILTQEIVWVPEPPIRRGSYTIDKADGFTEHYHSNEVVPVDNGVRRVAVNGVRGAAYTEENASQVIKREGYEQSVQKNVKNAKAHEKSQAATEEVRTGTHVEHLPDGGISTTTTTTTVRKVGTAARTANATTSVTRTATAVTSRDIGVK
jgi:hypothetical protein